MALLVWFLVIVPITALTTTHKSDHKIPECDSPCRWYGHNKTLDCLSRSCHVFPAEGSLPDDTRDLLLPFNHIRQLPDELQTQMSGLVTLDLRHNDISSIPTHAFRYMSNLEKLHLSFNSISEVSHQHLYGLSKLRQLDLDGNHLKSLEDGVFYPNMHGTLQHLDLSHNDLEQLNHNALTDLRVLEYLDLGSNRLSSLDPEHFAGLRALRVLKLNFNPIHVLQNDTFLTLHRLSDLELEHAQLEDIDVYAFRGLTKLDQLTLAYNELVDIQDRLVDLASLRFLTLTGNNMKHIWPNTFPPALEDVSITRCPDLRTVESSAFKDLLNLVTVQICHNPQLGYIAPNAFEAAAQILELYLNHNALRTLAEGLVTWSSIKQLDLSGNLWRCDCRIKWMGEVLHLSGLASQDLTCHEPRHLSGKPILDLGSSNLVCHSYITVHSKAALGLIALATAALLITVFCLCYRWRRQLLPCCTSASGKYVALFNVKDGVEDSVTICTDSDYRRSAIVKRKGLPEPEHV